MPIMIMKDRHEHDARAVPPSWGGNKTPENRNTKVGAGDESQGDRNENMNAISIRNAGLGRRAERDILRISVSHRTSFLLDASRRSAVPRFTGLGRSDNGKHERGLSPIRVQI